jgi:hypothetical protein
VIQSREEEIDGAAVSGYYKKMEMKGLVLSACDEEGHDMMSLPSNGEIEFWSRVYKLIGSPYIRRFSCIIMFKEEHKSYYLVGRYYYCC